MKKKFFKVLVGSLLFSSVFASGVFAGVNYEQITAYLRRDIILTWNGVQFVPKEADGSRVYPIIYNNRTYLPVKFIAEKAGLNVGWDEKTMTVKLSDANYVEPVSTIPKGEYKVLGGSIRFLTDNLEALTYYGYDVEETLATSNYGTHKIKINCKSNNLLERRAEYIRCVKTYIENYDAAEWNLTSSTPLNDGHIKAIFSHRTQPLKVELYSTDDYVMFLGNRTDMGTTVTPIIDTTLPGTAVTEGYEGYFSSVPKMKLDSTWKEEVGNAYNNWNVEAGDNAYTLSVWFDNENEDKVTAAFEQYKEDLVNSGFKLYNVSYERYTYIKGDISIEIYKGFHQIYVDLRSGYQAPHINF